MPYKDPEKQKAYQQAYHEANKEKRKAYLEANKEALASQQKAYREATKEKKAEYHKAYYEANKEKVSEKYRAYYEANKEKKAAQGKARTANLSDAYVAQRLRLSVHEVPSEFIELKRLLLQLKRELKNGLNQNC